MEAPCAPCAPCLLWFSKALISRPKEFVIVTDAVRFKPSISSNKCETGESKRQTEGVMHNTLNWHERNQQAVEDDLKTKEKELRDIVNRILTEVHQVVGSGEDRSGRKERGDLQKKQAKSNARWTYEPDTFTSKMAMTARCVRNGPRMSGGNVAESVDRGATCRVDQHRSRARVQDSVVKTASERCSCPYLDDFEAKKKKLKDTTRDDSEAKDDLRAREKKPPDIVNLKPPPEVDTCTDWSPCCWCSTFCKGGMCKDCIEHAQRDSDDTEDFSEDEPWLPDDVLEDRPLASTHLLGRWERRR